MAELVLTNVEDGILNQLKERAARHGRTSADEAKAILTEALDSQKGNPWAPVDAIYDRMVASGRRFSDSADLLREDRDR